jgi:hypothetical protein
MDEKLTATRWLGGISALAGLWLIISPFVLGLASTSSYWNAIVIGLAVLILGSYQMSQPHLTWPSWATFIAGLWLVASPYMFNPAETAAYTNAVVSGILVAIVALVAASSNVATTSEDRIRHQHM